MSTTDPKLDEYEPHRKLRFAVVGCGRIAQSHFAALKQHGERAELVAACDVVPQALDGAVALTGAASAFLSRPMRTAKMPRARRPASVTCCAVGSVR